MTATGSISGPACLSTINWPDWLFTVFPFLSFAATMMRKASFHASFPGKLFTADQVPYAVRKTETLKAFKFLDGLRNGLAGRMHAQIK